MNAIFCLYQHNDIYTFNPIISVSNDEILKIEPILKDYICALREYAYFCNTQTSTGQKRKNQRYKKRKSLFNQFHSETYKKYVDTINILKREKAKCVEPSVKVVISYDGRKKKNIYKFKQAVEMAFNVGGIAYPYYQMGFKSYKIIK